MITAIVVVALNTFRQTVRDRLFYNVIFFGLGMLLLSMVLGRITFGYPDRVVRSIGLSGVALALDLIALLISVSLIYQEIDRKTLFVVLTRPIHRWQYAFGRYLGLLMTLSMTLLGLSLAYALTLSAAFGRLTWLDVVALSAGLPEAAVLAGVGLVLSAFSTPTVSAGSGLGIWLAAATTDDLLRLTENGEPVSRVVAQSVYYLLPSLARFNFRELAVYQLPLLASDFALSLGYGAIYSLALVGLASAILARREMV